MSRLLHHGLLQQAKLLEVLLSSPKNLFEFHEYTPENEHVKYLEVSRLHPSPRTHS